MSSMWQGQTRTEVQAANTYVLKTGRGFLHTIQVQSTRPQSFTVYDGLDASGVVIWKAKGSIAEKTYTFDCEFATGLTIITGGLNVVVLTYS